MSDSPVKLNIKDYIDAANDAAKRTRTVTIVLVFASVLVFIGFYNSLIWSWPLDRLGAAYDPDDLTIYGALNIDKHPKVFPSPLFGAGDFTDLLSLARKLTDREDPLSAYLYDHLRKRTQELLEQRVNTDKPEKHLLADLVEHLVVDLNNLLNDQSLYNLGQFQVDLTDETNKLRKRNPTKGEELNRLNRFLLEDAYPYEIAKSYKTNQANEFRKELQAAGATAYVENVRFVRIPFFGIAFDVNDLGIIGGIGFIIILLLLRHCLSNEIKSLKFSFREALRDDQLYNVYHALAMRQVFTVPEMYGEERNKLLAISAKVVCILPAVIFFLGLLYDYGSVLLYELYKIKEVWPQLLVQIPLFGIIFYLSRRCWERQSHIDGIWKDNWERIKNEKSPVVLLDKDLVEEFGTDEAVNSALRNLRAKASEDNSKLRPDDADRLRESLTPESGDNTKA